MIHLPRMLTLLGASIALLHLPGRAQTPAASPVRYLGAEQADTTHDGGLRWAVGVKSWQALRANRSHPEFADGFGWTYNHAPMLAYWRDRFWIEYLSAPVHENRGPMHTLLMSSTNGIHWEQPRVAFPEYKTADGTIFQVHQRMGFHVAPDGRLLVLGFYGPERKPNEGGGIGRTVREVYPNGTFGPIYFIRYSRHNGWSESNTAFPSYTHSTDAGFKRACDALLANKLVTLQWWEEDRAKDGFYPDLGDQCSRRFPFTIAKMAPWSPSGKRLGWRSLGTKGKPGAAQSKSPRSSCPRPKCGASARPTAATPSFTTRRATIATAGRSPWSPATMARPSTNCSPWSGRCRRAAITASTRRSVRNTSAASWRATASRPAMLSGLRGP